MKLHEYQAKAMLAEQGIPVVPGRPAATDAEALSIAREIAGPVVVKAQVHAGGRGKAGGILLVSTPEEARAAAARLLGKPLKGLTVERVLVEEQVRPDRELYLGLTLDRPRKRSALLFSLEGGVDIEELAASRPQAIHRLSIGREAPPREAVASFLEAAGAPGVDRLTDLVLRLHAFYVSRDAELVEINPLAWTASRGYLALDAKVVIDDNALFRQPLLEEYRSSSETDEIEREAHRRRLAYVRLDGDIGILGNGAGLVMATMDEVGRAGGHPADFLDIGGGARAEVVQSAMDVVLMDPRVRGLFVNIFGGITRGDEVARGLLAAEATMRRRIPVVIRLVGTRAEEGRAILSQAGRTSVATMQEGARQIVDLVGRAR
jgi:succinyl-CoA synthetase beta subunit